VLENRSSSSKLAQKQPKFSQKFKKHPNNPTFTSKTVNFLSIYQQLSKHATHTSLTDHLQLLETFATTTIPEHREKLIKSAN
jgi:hypothetical protein